jgi:hypothetical protein
MLLRACKRCDVVLVVLRGTPSHDYNQPVLFEAENNDSKIGCELCYVNTLAIIYIERFDINILCVPDEWRANPDITWNEIQLLMVEKGLEQVDFSLVHGTFEHQLPAHIKTNRHTNARFLSITKYLIFIGHIHLHSVFERIISHGSTDRFAHNEEGPKGIIDATINPNGEWTATFVENTNAWVYHTVDCVGMTLEELFEKLHYVRKFPPESHLRIRVRRGDPGIMAMEVIRKEYPLYNWTIKVEDAITNKDVQRIAKAHVTPTQLTSTNIYNMIADRLALKINDPVILARALTTVTEMLNNESSR